MGSATRKFDAAVGFDATVGLTFACFPIGVYPDKLHAPLRYGDSISLLPDGCNALVVYSGSEDGQTWIETMQRHVNVPPNLRDCQWRLQPSRCYIEAKKLQKFLKSHDWDNGKGLNLPEIPPKGSDVHQHAQEFVTTSKLPQDKEHVVAELMLMLGAAQAELEGNLAGASCVL